MKSADQKVIDTAAVLEALRPFQDTARDAELLKAAWDIAWREFVIALEEYRKS